MNFYRTLGPDLGPNCLQKLPADLVGRVKYQNPMKAQIKNNRITDRQTNTRVVFLKS